MANLGVLATVCVLAVMTDQVNGQCPQATKCFNDLGIETNPAAGLAVDIQNICSESDQVLHCYDVLLQCASITPAITVLPTNQQMQKALQTLCQNKTELVNGFNCLARQQAYPTETSNCANQLQTSNAGLTPAQQKDIKGSYCRGVSVSVDKRNGMKMQ
ncbi:uncharacterized protein LOC110459275 isoform X2 [Mizuhopecten yessoensis]|uniref:uncharacterized protein LOC110459275 isoform X2 n=1 Tax=Mizuhopecten yessoensis TaxID=6573 RepID=UPI000B45BD9B|nr:uncharacterized protein LOC110459275 isoform X2 [Mizuhopecten yessoensis]